MSHLHLVNLGIHNGGDLLMAMAAGSRLRGGGPLVVDGRWTAHVDELRIAHGQRNWLDRLKRTLAAARASGLSAGSPLFRSGDLVLDINGFRHGERWPEKNLTDDLERAYAIRKAGAHYVLMPKSYGPFNERTGPMMRELLALADLAYARDRLSIDHCLAFGAAPRFSPDYTIDIQPPAGVAMPAHDRRSVVYIPNSKLVERGLFEDFASYAVYIRDCVRAVQGRGFRVTVLFHQGKDLGALKIPLQQYGLNCEFHANPLKAKGVLRQSAFVVSSRYHGMIGALTQDVPCLVMGWSYKYAGFLEYCPAAQPLLIHDVSTDSFVSKLDWLLEEGRIPALRKDLATSNQALAQRSAAMWADIARLSE